VVILAVFVYIGELILSIVTLILGFQVINTFMDKRNPISLYLIGFFFCISIGYAVLFLESPLIFNNYNTYWWIAILFGASSFVCLTGFIGLVLEIRSVFLKIIIIIIFFVTLIHALYREFYIYSILATIVIFCSSILFFYIFRKNHDKKALGFGIALICILIAEPIRNANETSNVPFFLFIAASFFFSVGFYFEKIKRKK
jgi:hypothetical protein